MSSKCNRVYTVIDLDAICANIDNIKKKVGSNTKIMAVIKADAYGHGSVQVARTLCDKVYGYAVATVGEAAVLRRADIHAPILILDYVFSEEFEQLLDYDIIATIYRYESAFELNRIAQARGRKAKIHIKIDTGMGRIGYIPSDESLEEIIKISKLENITIDGIYTHFAGADMKDKTSMNLQLKKFNEFVKRIEEKGIIIPIKHVCNSAAAMEFESNYFDMIRSGIITYGLYPSDEVKKQNLKLYPALEMKSRVINVKTIQKGDAVSYGSTYVAKEPTVIATIPVGYADGYPRSLSNKAEVLIHGKRAKITGRVCMDQLMVDVSSIDNVKIGDDVTLIGRDGEEYISVDELGKIADRFNYEFLCCISKRVPKVYKIGGQIVKSIDFLDYEV